jgi:hypothetical protein
MQLLTISDEHMKKRCMFMSILCGASLYNWYNYSLFDPISNDVYTTYYQNCLFMLFYLGWDTYHMTVGPNRHVLFRTDLIIHHSLCLVVFASYINHTPLQLSNFTIMECISVMNYAWRNNPILLNIYRLLCIGLLRIPLITWHIVYYNPHIGLPFLRDKLLPTHHYNYLCGMEKLNSFFIIYDIFIVWKIYKQMRRMNDKQNHICIT